MSGFGAYVTAKELYHGNFGGAGGAAVFSLVEGLMLEGLRQYEKELRKDRKEMDALLETGVRLLKEARESMHISQEKIL